MKIPKVMSTQHPDNVTTPYFARNTQLSGDDEVLEAYYAYSHLGCDEQMWDCEGKEVDNFVVKKLFIKDDSFFKENKLGQDIFLTLRVPNPEEEKAEAKILLEQLEGIPRVFDIAKIFYGEDIAPIFEVILPMAGSADSIDRIYKYYMNFVVGKNDKSTKEGDITIGEWIGEFNPKKINVIPLFEDKEHLLNAADILKEYLKDKNVDYQRVFLARSDPALNYGLVSAMLLIKIALQDLDNLSKEIGVKIYPMLGVGSAPFRGNLTPKTVERITNEYPSNHTFTIQSAFKYDYSPYEVKEAIKKLKEFETTLPHKVDKEKTLKIVDKYTKEYQKQITQLAPIINMAAKYVPSRRKRKLHTGLFGYSRSMDGITFPRAIKFTAALYSIGLPPELLGLNALSKEDIEYIKTIYVNFEQDLIDSVKYLNLDTGLVPQDLKTILEEFQNKFGYNKEHKEITSKILKLLKESDSNSLEENIVMAAKLRNFLG